MSRITNLFSWFSRERSAPVQEALPPLPMTEFLAAREARQQSVELALATLGNPQQVLNELRAQLPHAALILIGDINSTLPLASYARDADASVYAAVQRGVALIQHEQALGLLLTEAATPLETVLVMHGQAWHLLRVLPGESQFVYVVLDEPDINLALIQGKIEAVLSELTLV